jgi:hypothetical protein
MGTQPFERLNTALQRAHEQLHMLSVTVGEDHPEGEASSIDALHDRLSDAIGLVAEASTLVSDLAGAETTSWQLSAGALRRTNELHLSASQLVRDGVQRDEMIVHLRRLAVDRGGAWVPWARVVGTGLIELLEPLAEVDRAVAACWEALLLAARQHEPSVSSIGQQIAIHVAPTPHE